MNLSQVMTELKKKGSPQTVKTYSRHGAPETMFGVKVGDLKPIAKKIKGDQQLAQELYATGNSDAMYLAGLVADGSLMTKKQLDAWARQAPWYMISEYTVPWVTCDSPHARQLALKWMKSRQENVASSGWATYAAMLGITPDESLDLDEIRDLLKTVEQKIHEAPNRVRYTMNGFVIAVGTWVKPLLPAAKATAKKIGKVQVDMGQTACKVPLAAEYIARVEKAGRVGKKQKSVRC
jgi:3-methyladenine DNA glycosylase AlkD